MSLECVLCVRGVPWYCVVFFVIFVFFFEILLFFFFITLDLLFDFISFG